MPVIRGQCRWRATDLSERGNKVWPLCFEMPDSDLLCGDGSVGGSVDAAAWCFKGFARDCLWCKVHQRLNTVQDAQKGPTELVGSGKTLWQHV